MDTTVVVLAAALLLAGLIYQRAKTFTMWVGLSLVLAIVFNPIVPLHLTRGVWSIFNVASATLFIGHFVFRPLPFDRVRRTANLKSNSLQGIPHKICAGVLHGRGERLLVVG
jgi:4-hydroxybenzoate polyprenyltransferase